MTTKMMVARETFQRAECLTGGGNIAVIASVPTVKRTKGSNGCPVSSNGDAGSQQRRKVPEQRKDAGLVNTLKEVSDLVKRLHESHLLIQQLETRKTQNSPLHDSFANVIMTCQERYKTDIWKNAEVILKGYDQLRNRYQQPGEVVKRISALCHLSTEEVERVISKCIQIEDFCRRETEKTSPGRFYEVFAGNKICVDFSESLKRIEAERSRMRKPSRQSDTGNVPMQNHEPPRSVANERSLPMPPGYPVIVPSSGVQSQNVSTTQNRYSVITTPSRHPFTALPNDMSAGNYHVRNAPQYPANNPSVSKSHQPQQSYQPRPLIPTTVQYMTEQCSQPPGFQQGPSQQQQQLRPPPPMWQGTRQMVPTSQMGHALVSGQAEYRGPTTSIPLYPQHGQQQRQFHMAEPRSTQQWTPITPISYGPQTRPEQPPTVIRDLLQPRQTQQLQQVHGQHTQPRLEYPQYVDRRPQFQQRDALAVLESTITQIMSDQQPSPTQFLPLPVSQTTTVGRFQPQLLQSSQPTLADSEVSPLSNHLRSLQVPDARSVLRAALTVDQPASRQLPIAPCSELSQASVEQCPSRGELAVEPPKESSCPDSIEIDPTVPQKLMMINHRLRAGDVMLTAGPDDDNDVEIINVSNEGGGRSVVETELDDGSDVEILQENDDADDDSIEVIKVTRPKQARRILTRVVLCAEDSCRNVGSHICTECQTVVYCGETCQRKHWDRKHKEECRKLKELH